MCRQLSFLRLAMLAATLLGAPASPAAERPPQKTLFENAEFVRSDDRRPPPDSEAWQPVRLPHEWRHTHPGATGLGWYRIRFQLDRVPRVTQALSIPHVRSRSVEFYVNGALIGGSREVTTSAGGRGFGAPVFLTIPPSLLKAGENVIHARLATAAHPINIQGLGRLTVGDARQVRVASYRTINAGFLAERSFHVMAFVVGLITLFCWLARRADRVMLWFSITCLSWGVAGALRHELRWLDLAWLNPVLNVYLQFGLVVPAVILCLRTVGLRWRTFELALWIFLAIEVTYPLWSERSNTYLFLTWHVVNGLLLLVGAAILMGNTRRPLRWPQILQFSALVLMAGLMLHEVLRYLGWIDIESAVIRQYHVPAMVLAIGAAIFERHVAAIWRMEQTNIDLEQRVQEKVREIEAYHAEREAVMRQQALAAERQRIITDMHDGLGASLVGLLRYVQARNTDPQVEQRLKEALQELRIAIDALEPAEGDLASVLGNLRYRLEPLLEPAGVCVDWNVSELPRIEGLDPTSVFAVQRIVLEAVANALKHSGARTVRLGARTAADGQVEIDIEDDGRGFDLARPASGLGLASMRGRAARIGARVEVESAPGRGTRVKLALPGALPRPAPAGAAQRQDADSAQELVPAQGAA